MNNKYILPCIIVILIILLYVWLTYYSAPAASAPSAPTAPATSAPSAPATSAPSAPASSAPASSAPASSAPSSDPTSTPTKGAPGSACNVMSDCDTDVCYYGTCIFANKSGLGSLCTLSKNCTEGSCAPSNNFFTCASNGAPVNGVCPPGTFITPDGETCSLFNLNGRRYTEASNCRSGTVINGLCSMPNITTESTCDRLNGPFCQYGQYCSENNVCVQVSNDSCDMNNGCRIGKVCDIMNSQCVSPFTIGIASSGRVYPISKINADGLTKLPFKTNPATIYDAAEYCYTNPSCVAFDDQTMYTKIAPTTTGGTLYSIY